MKNWLNQYLFRKNPNVTFLGKMKVYEKNANSIHNAYSMEKIEKLPCSKQFLGKVDRNNAVAIGKNSMKWI